MLIMFYDDQTITCQCTTQVWLIKLEIILVLLSKTGSPVPCSNRWLIDWLQPHFGEKVRQKGCLGQCCNITLGLENFVPQKL